MNTIENNIKKAAMDAAFNSTIKQLLETCNWSPEETVELVKEVLEFKVKQYKNNINNENIRKFKRIDC